MGALYQIDQHARARGNHAHAHGRRARPRVLLSLLLLLRSLPSQSGLFSRRHTSHPTTPCGRDQRRRLQNMPCTDECMRLSESVGTRPAWEAGKLDVLRLWRSPTLPRGACRREADEYTHVVPPPRPWPAQHGLFQTLQPRSRRGESSVASAVHVRSRRGRPTGMVQAPHRARAQRRRSGHRVDFALSAAKNPAWPLRYWDDLACRTAAPAPGACPCPLRASAATTRPPCPVRSRPNHHSA